MVPNFGSQCGGSNRVRLSLSTYTASPPALLYHQCHLCHHHHHQPLSASAVHLYPAVADRKRHRYFRNKTLNSVPRKGGKLGKPANPDLNDWIFSFRALPRLRTIQVCPSAPTGITHAHCRVHGPLPVGKQDSFLNIHSLSSLRIQYLALT